MKESIARMSNDKEIEGEFDLVGPGRTRYARTIDFGGEVRNESVIIACCHKCACVISCPPRLTSTPDILFFAIVRY